MSKKRRQHSPALKAQVGLEALKNIDPVHAIAARHGVHPTQVSQWKKEAVERLPEVFVRMADRNGMKPRSGRRICSRRSVIPKNQEIAPHFPYAFTYLANATSAFRGENSENICPPSGCLIGGVINASEASNRRAPLKNFRGFDY